MNSDKMKIVGFLKEAKQNASGATYRGRLTCPNVQWTYSGDNPFCTFTITAGEIADAASSQMLWTDQDVQRGIQPSAALDTDRELSLSQGYPAPEKYVFDREKADEIAEKLLNGEKLYLNPLVWNMRPSNFEAYYDEKEHEIFIYSGKLYLPDSHHRHQGIIKAVKIWRDNKKDYKKFDENMQFKIELYFFSREDEGNYFYDKNQLTKQVAKSKSYDLTTEDDLSVLAKKVVANSTNLEGNINRVTDRLDAKNTQVITLSTLREMMRTFAGGTTFDASEVDGMAIVAAQFYDMLAEVRPELRKTDIKSRNHYRRYSLADAAVMMHGYAYLMRDYNLDIGRMGAAQAKKIWQTRLQNLSASPEYKFRQWSGDLFEKQNSLWTNLGVTKIGAEGKITVVNTGSSRTQAGRALRQLVVAEPRPSTVEFLAPG